MTDQIESYLREQFTADAERAPLARDLAGAARAQARRQRRRNAGVVAAGLAAALVAGVTYGVAGSPGTAGPPARGVTPVADGVLSFRGIEVNVPKAWLVSPSDPCAVSMPRNVAYVSDGDQNPIHCYRIPVDAHPERRSKVVLQPWDLPTTFEAPPVGERVLDDGRTQVVRRLARRDVRLIVTSPDGDLARAIAASGRLEPSPTASPSRQAAGPPGVLDRWLEQPNAYTEMVAAPPDGGRVYCGTKVVSTNRAGTDLYVWALCEQMYAKDGTAADGSGAAGPLVMHVTRRVDATGSSVVAKVTGIDFPRDQSLDPDIDRLFPAGVADVMHRGNLDMTSAAATIQARAEADLAAGRLGPAPGTPTMMAVRFLGYARGEYDGLPVDTPVQLYLGNQYQKTIQPTGLGDLRTWQVCAAYAGRSCPMSALDTLQDREGPMATIAAAPPATCLQTLTNRPTRTGGSHSIVLTAYHPATCADAFAVQIWSNDVGQITSVNLLLGRASP
jgi:hypothetical protein